MFFALRRGHIKAKVNKSHDFLYLKVSHGRVFMESELSAPQFLRASDIVQTSAKANTLRIYLRESNDKIVTISFEFEKLDDMEVFRKWIKKRSNSPKKVREESPKKRREERTTKAQTSPVDFQQQLRADLMTDAICLDDYEMLF